MILLECPFKLIHSVFLKKISILLSLSRLYPHLYPHLHLELTKAPTSALMVLLIHSNFLKDLPVRRSLRHYRHLNKLRLELTKAFRTILAETSVLLLHLMNNFLKIYFHLNNFKSTKVWMMLSLVFIQLIHSGFLKMSIPRSISRLYPHLYLHLHLELTKALTSVLMVLLIHSNFLKDLPVRHSLRHYRHLNKLRLELTKALRTILAETSVLLPHLMNSFLKIYLHLSNFKSTKVWMILARVSIQLIHSGFL